MEGGPAQQAEDEKTTWIGVIMILVTSGRKLHSPSTKGDGKKDPHRQAMRGRGWSDEQWDLYPSTRIHTATTEMGLEVLA